MATQLISVDHTGFGSYALTFNSTMTVGGAGQFVWPHGVPSGASIVAKTSTSFALSGISFDALQAMRPEVSSWLAQASVITSDGFDPSAARGNSGGSVDAPHVELDETARQKVKEVTKEILDGVHVFHTTVELEEYVASSVGNAAEEGGAVASTAEEFAAAAETIGEVAGPFAAVAFIAWVGFEVIDAFESERRLEEQQGFVYGLMWEAMGEADHLPEFVDGITYSAAEHREAFTSGVQQGREKARDAKLRAQLQLQVATLGARTGFGDTYAAGELLSALWRHGREHSPGDSDTDTLPWPVPPNRGWF